MMHVTAALDRARALLDQPTSPPHPGQLAVPDGPRIGSICSGYRGLDMAVEQVFGGTTAWVSDIDPGASAILAHHWPTTPNLGDLTAVGWEDVEPIDIVCGGYPCQPFSTAGKRKGTADARHIWPYIATALRVLRPRIAIFENVANHLRIGFDTVLADLAAIGFDAEWCLVRASEVGAPHERKRLIVLAWPADADGPGLEGAGLRRTVAERLGAAADAADLGHERSGRARDGRPGPADGGLSTADTSSVGRDGHGELPAGRDTVRRGLRSDAPGRGPVAADADGIRWGAQQLHLRARELDATWGRYAPAIAQWEPIQGRRVPRAVDDRRRLTPEFVEWHMGLPAGHVTDPAIWQGWRPTTARRAQLKALGNGVVPRQAAAALQLLFDRASTTP